MAVLAVLVVLLAGCGTSVATSPPAPTGSQTPVGPAATRWPGWVITAVVALGAADNDMKAFIAAFTTAVDDGDLKAMWGAADGLVTMVGSLTPNVDRLADYEPTTHLAAAYRAALPGILQAATDLRRAITAGDAATVQSASLRLIDGLKLYYGLREELAIWVTQSVFQGRILLQ